MAQSQRIPLKPDSWPAGHRAALAVLIDLDPPEQPWPAPSPIASAAGAARLLEMLADLDIVPTVVADPAVQTRAALPEGIDIDVAARPDGGRCVRRGGGPARRAAERRREFLRGSDRAGRRSSLGSGRHR